jgi:c-di-GMP-binding flagellar brake protein YcgR
MSLIPIGADELEIGKVLPWNVFDPTNTQLAASGEVIRSEEHLLALLERKPCRELTWEANESGSGTDELSSEQITAGSKSADPEQTSFPFDAMKLKVGDRLQIQPPVLLSPERFIVKLIGFVNNVSVLVTAPIDAKGMRLQLVEDEELVVRVFSSQNAFGFPCTVRKINKVPFDYLHLSFPTEVQGMVIRKAPRVRTRIIAAISTGGAGEDNASGIISNLSANGALLDARRNLADKGALIKLSFRVNLHNMDAYLTISAAIRAVFGDDVLENESTGLIHHGLEFVNLPPNDSVILQSMIYQQMIEQPQTVV